MPYIVCDFQLETMNALSPSLRLCTTVKVCMCVSSDKRKSFRTHHHIKNEAITKMRDINLNCEINCSMTIFVQLQIEPSH